MHWRNRRRVRRRTSGRSHYNYERNYDPATGRYVESDPIGLAAGVNTYIYVGGNPLLYIDALGLCWIYHQGTGQIQHVDANGNVTYSATGYAGHGLGINNPAMQNVAGGHNVANSGPLPQGSYNIGTQQDNTTAGGVNLPASMRLSQANTNQMFNRDGFLIHGDNSRGGRSASDGCIVLNKAARDAIGSSNDHCLQVVQ
jgi:RHS repeat-associated protein